MANRDTAAKVDLQAVVRKNVAVLDTVVNLRIGVGPNHAVSLDIEAVLVIKAKLLHRRHHHENVVVLQPTVVGQSEVARAIVASRAIVSIITEEDVHAHVVVIVNAEEDL